MKKILFFLFFCIFYSNFSIAMESETKDAVEITYLIDAYLWRHRRKRTNIEEVKTFVAETHKSALSQLKKYAKDHNYKYSIQYEGQVKSEISLSDELNEKLGNMKLEN